MANEQEKYDLDLYRPNAYFLGTGQLNLFRKPGADVPVNQAGWAGVIMGRMDFEFLGYKINPCQNLVL